MESAAVLQSFHCSAGGVSSSWFSPEKANVVAWPTTVQSQGQALAVGKIISPARKRGVIVSCAKTPEATVSSKSDVSQNDRLKGSTEKHALRASFPNAFEALLLEVCDETSVAELQLKIGDIEMHLKRNVGGTSTPILAAPPVPSEPMVQSAAVATSAPKPSSEKANPFARDSALSSTFASLEVSGNGGHKLVTSPTVGSFRRGRTVKGKTQAPVCKQGDVIKEGQVIGYIDRFGNQLPVKSDVAGEVLKVLEDGKAIGYGDPLIAVLPSFHGLN